MEKLDTAKAWLRLESAVKFFLEDRTIIDRLILVLRVVVVQRALPDREIVNRALGPASLASHREELAGRVVLERAAALLIPPVENFLHFHFRLLDLEVTH